MEREKPNFVHSGKESTGSGWLVDGLNTPLPRTLV